MLEFRHEHWQIFRETLFTTGKRAEYIKLERLISHNYKQKNLWRSRQLERNALREISPVKITFAEPGEHEN